MEREALTIASDHVREAARKAAQKRVKKIKCLGCGTLLDTSQQFQEHCMDDSVEHGDDFAFDCEEIEVVYEGDEGVPEGTIDLTDEKNVRTFYNTPTYTFSNCYP